MAIGKASIIDSVDNMMVSGRPPHRSVSTFSRPAKPPYITAKKNASTAIQAGSSQAFQNARVQLPISMASMTLVASSGRHWSS